MQGQIKHEGQRGWSWVLAVMLLMVVAIQPLAWAAEDETIKPEDAAKYYDQEKTVKGLIVRTHTTGKEVFLNFSHDRNGFYAIIFNRLFNQFPEAPEHYFRNKTVTVTGKITEHKGRPQIIINSVDQIKIVE